MINILTVQFCPKISDRETNLQKAAEIIEQNAHKNPDLIVLPEFFNSGIGIPAFERLAETEENSPTKEFFVEIAKKYNSWILLGSIIEKKDGKLYNTSRLLDRNGKMTAKYRKINLFKYFGGTEDQYITPGNEPVVVDTELGKIGFCTCFDISYPKHFAQLAKMGAEIVLCPSAWCKPSNERDYKLGLEKWKSFNLCRAADYSVYLISSNQCGKIDSSFSCLGHSMIVSFNGEVLADAGEDEGAAFSQISICDLKEYRKSAPVWF